MEANNLSIILYIVNFVMPEFVISRFDNVHIFAISVYYSKALLGTYSFLKCE